MYNSRQDRETESFYFQLTISYGSRKNLIFDPTFLLANSYFELLKKDINFMSSIRRNDINSSSIRLW